MTDIKKPSYRKPIGALVVTAALAAGVSQHEGFRSSSYMPTPDDRPTIGYGSTFNEDGSAVRMGQKVTKERALVMLGNDLNQYANAVKRCTPVPMYDHEFGAYVSLTYNIGPGAFCASTLAKKLNAFDYPGACREILKWDKQAGKTLRGLTKRRQEEYRICMGES